MVRQLSAVEIRKYRVVGRKLHRQVVMRRIPPFGFLGMALDASRLPNILGIAKVKGFRVLGASGGECASK